jgi:alpha-tubulin suppressor-like RCC1 family protein
MNIDEIELGEVYTWGSGSHGKLGHDNDDDVYIPRRISWLNGRPVEHVACAQHRLLATIRMYHSSSISQRLVSLHNT